MDGWINEWVVERGLHTKVFGLHFTFLYSLHYILRQKCNFNRVVMQVMNVK